MNEQKDQFLIAWYDVLWRNIDRSMTGMWQILAPITVVGTGLWAVGQSHLPIWLGGTAILLVVFWAINITIDLNSWHRRNLFILSAVESRFLDETDYGKLIPAGYRKPKREWMVFYVVHGSLFVVLGVFSFIYLVSLATKSGKCYLDLTTIIITFVVGLGFSGWHFLRDCKNVKTMHDELYSEIPD